MADGYLHIPSSAKIRRNVYAKYIEENNLNIYGEQLIKLPAPQYIVFYNGRDNREDEEILRLSDAFEGSGKTEGYEWTARMLNINYGRNRKLMEKCKSLKDYSILVDKIKRYTKEKKNIKEAVNQAINECIEEDILADFLRTHKAEVIDVCITEYNEERVMDAIRTEGYEEGHSMGLQEGRTMGLQEGRTMGLQEGRTMGLLEERIHGIRNLIQCALDLGADIEMAFAKAAEQYQKTEQQIRDIWESRE